MWRWTSREGEPMWDTLEAVAIGALLAAWGFLLWLVAPPLMATL
jgi:hypothetical protein